MRKILLTVIFLLALFLRFYHLGQNPPSLAWDEAAWGYNAYSLGINGKDEFGRFLPHDYLESFGDFKPPVYAYLDVLPVKFLGLNEFATRLPSAFLGSLTVLLTYFLVKFIFKNERKSEYIATTSSFILAISPWHINLSRAAFEANVATFFLVSGVLLFFVAMQKKPLLLIFSAASFVVSLYTFNTARIIAPLLVFLLTIGFRKQLLELKKEVVVSVFVGILLFLPIAKFLISPQANLRFREVNIFSDASVINRTNQEIANDNGSSLSKVVHNRRLEYSVDFLKHYFDNLSPDFLFIKGDGNPKFSIQDVGQMYIWEFPFFIAGAFLLFRRKSGYWWVIPWWLILGILPSATARETPHALRIEAALPTFQILSAIGLVEFFYWAFGLKKLQKKIVTIFVLFIVFFNFIYYYHTYYAHYPIVYSGEWQYGYKDSITYVEGVQKQYDNVYVTSDLGRPYVYYLFYLKYSPQQFRETAQIKRDAFGFVDVQSFDKYHFGKELPTEKKGKSLYINTPSSVPGNANVLRTFYLLNGNKALVAYTL